MRALVLDRPGTRDTRRLADPAGPLHLITGSGAGDVTDTSGGRFGPARGG